MMDRSDAPPLAAVEACPARRECPAYLAGSSAAHSASFFTMRATSIPLNRPGCTCLRIPTMPITHSDLMAITIPSDADHRRSEATLGCSYHAEVIGIRQAF